MFKKVKKIKLRGHICEVVATERLWYKNDESVKNNMFFLIKHIKTTLIK